MTETPSGVAAEGARRAGGRQPGTVPAEFAALLFHPAAYAEAVDTGDPWGDD
jgi:hypothetical protein